MFNFYYYSTQDIWKWKLFIVVSRLIEKLCMAGSSFFYCILPASYFFKLKFLKFLRFFLNFNKNLWIELRIAGGVTNFFICLSVRAFIPAVEDGKTLFWSHSQTKVLDASIFKMYVHVSLKFFFKAYGLSSMLKWGMSEICHILFYQNWK